MAYVLKLTVKEIDALSWCSARYESARILYNGMIMQDGSAEEGYTLDVPEHVAWNARDAIAEDGGASWEDGGFIPCLDSPAIRDLFERIV